MKMITSVPENNKIFRVESMKSRLWIPTAYINKPTAINAIPSIVDVWINADNSKCLTAYNTSPRCCDVTKAQLTSFISSSFIIISSSNMLAISFYHKVNSARLKS